MRNSMDRLLLFGMIAAAFAVYPLERQSFATVSNTTVSTTTALGDGSTTTFAIGFDFRDNSWLNVVRHDNADGSNTTISQGSGASKYTVSGGNPGTAVVMGTAPSITQYLVITRSIPLTQPVVFNAASIFPYAGLSAQVDQMTLELQNLNAGIGGSSGGGGGGGGAVLPTGVANNLLGWDATGATAVNIPNATLIANTFPLWNGTTWTQQSFTGAGLVGLINGAAAPITGGSGGTGVSNSGTLTWNHNLQFTLTGDSNLTLPTSGTLIAGTADNNNTGSTLVKRDSSGNFSSNVITANSFVGSLTGSVTGSITGNVSGTAANVTGTVAIGHGGTGQTTQQAALTALTGAQTNHYVVKSDGTNAALGALTTGDLPSSIPYSKMEQQTHNSLLWSDGSGNEGVIATNVNSGYALLSDGTKPFWGPVGSGVPGIFPYGADTGGANSYVVASPNPPVPVLSPGIGLSFIAGNSNTGASTVNVSGIGAVSITHADLSGLSAGDILSGQMVVIEYDGTEFQIVNPNTLQPSVATYTATGAVGGSVTEILANCTLNCTLTLPAIAASTKPVPRNLKNLATTTVTVVGSGTDTVDGAASAVINFQYQAITLVPTSTGWVIQ